MRAARHDCRACGRSNRASAVYCDQCGAALTGRTPNGDELRTPATGMSGGAAVSGRFVGRAEALTVLRTALDRSHQGSTQIFLLTGQAGIGKTRTALELTEEARQRGIRPCWGRCLEEPGAPPYWPWTQLIRSALKDRDQQGDSELLGDAIGPIAGIMPELTERFPDLKSMRRPSEPEQARFQLFDGVAQLWSRAARAQPILLVLDDLHWADATSLRLLTFLASTISDSPLMVLGTYRDEDVVRQHPLNDMLAELARIPNVQRYRLSGLTHAESEHLIAAVSGAAPSPSLCAVLHERTEGNPLYLTETIRWLSQEARLRSGSGTEPDIALRIPEGIRHIILKRLNRLTPSCNNLLRVAAVIGKTFWSDLLPRLIPEASEEALLGNLEEALTARLIDESAQPDHYQFSHGLVREVLYSELVAGRRARLHQQIGELLEELAGARQEVYLAQLAFHFSQAPSARSAEKAIDYAARAAKRADELLAYEEASRLYQLALHIIAARDVVANARQVELMLDLGQAQAKSGEALRAMETFKRAAASAQDLDLPDHLARGALGFEEASWRPGLHGDAALRLLKTALVALAETNIDLKVNVLCALARAFILTGDLEEADRIHAQALQLARASGNAEALLASLRAGLSARWRPERIGDRLLTATEALTLARAIGDDERFTEVLGWRLFDAMEVGDAARVSADLRTHTQCTQGLRQPFYQYVNASFKAMLALFEGRFVEGEQRIAEARALGQRMPGLDVNGVFGMQMFTLRREQGRLHELAPVVRHFVETTPEAATWRPGLALIYAELGLKNEALAAFGQLAADDFAGIARDGMRATCLAYMAEVCAFLGDAARAATLYRLLLPYRAHNILAGTTVACLGAAARHLGLLAQTLNNWRQAEEHFEDALAMNARTGAKPWLAHTRHDYAVMLKARGNNDDRARIVSLLDGALALAEELGMTALVRRVAAFEQQLGHGRGKVCYPDGLTRREVEVAELIAAGKSNSDIGAILFISPNTVANHVRNILSKTNMANRASVAAYAVRHALSSRRAVDAPLPPRGQT